ncbi:suppressor of tub2 mutation [Umbelopsis sp. WA50703]
MQTKFKDKESEFNWEARESSIIHLRALLHGNAVQDWPNEFAQGIHDLTDAILKGLHSLRTTLSLATLSLIEDLASCLGGHLDNYTYDTLLQNLLRCALLSKKLVATSSMTTTITFLTETPYHSKVMPHLWTLFSDKNIQARHYATVYASSFAQAHGGKAKGPFERSGGLDILTKIIQKGLTDAAPAVRNAARDGFWIFYSQWRDRGERLLKSLDQNMQKQLQRSKPGTIAAGPPPSQTNRTASSSSLGSTASQRPTLKTSNTSLRSSASIHSDHSKSKYSSTSSIPKTVSPSISNTSSASNESQISSHNRKALVSSKSATSKYLPAPKTNTTSNGTHHVTPHSSTGLRKPSITPRRPSVSELIRSDDDNARSTGILTIAEKLLESPYNFGSISTPTPGLPSNSILVPALISNLKKPSSPACATLMSWDGIAGVVGKLCTVEQFTPPLIMAMELENADQPTHRVLMAGLQRWKRLLKRFDADLPQVLLKSFLVTLSGQQHSSGSGDSSHLDHANRQVVATTLAEWMDELVCVVVGLYSDDADESQDDQATAVAWLGEVEDVAPSWFENDANLRIYLSKLIPILLSTTPSSNYYHPLLQLIGHLRLVHESVFQAILVTLDAAVVDRLCRALGIFSPLPDVTEQDGQRHSMKDLVESENASNFQAAGMDVDSTDVTEDISKISLEHLEEEPEMEAEIATLAVLSAERLMKNGKQAPQAPETPAKEKEPITQVTMDQVSNGQDNNDTVQTPQREKPSLIHTPPSWSRRQHSDDPTLQEGSINANDDMENSKRHKTTQTSNNSPFSRSIKNRSTTLIPLITRLNSGAQALDDAVFKKLVRLAKENPIMQRWDQGGSGADGADLWNGEKNDGGNFRDLVLATLPYLSQSEDGQKYKEDILHLFKQLLLCQPGLWKYWCVASPEDEGISINTITTLLFQYRASSVTNVMSAVDDTLDTFFFTLDGDICLETLFKFLSSKLDDQPATNSEDTWAITHLNPITSAFSYVAKVAPRCDPQRTDEKLANDAAGILVKGCNYPQVSARKACVDAIVNLNQLVPGGIIKHLQDLRDDQMRLVQHYINKAQSKSLHKEASPMQRLYSS